MEIEIDVCISGPVGSRKSTVMRRIEKYLETLGEINIINRKHGNSVIGPTESETINLKFNNIP